MVIPHIDELLKVMNVKSLKSLKSSRVKGDKVIDAIQLLLRSVSFDENFYIETYPDIKSGLESEIVISPHDHFCTHGYFEGRLPNLTGFNPTEYISANSDLSIALGDEPSENTLVKHYVMCGFKEGRYRERPNP